MSHGHMTPLPPEAAGLQVPGPAQDKNRDRIATLWGGSLPIMASDPVGRYLIKNGLHADTVSHLRAALRFHPSLEYWGTTDDGIHKRISTFPGLLAAVQPPIHNNMHLPPVLLRVYLTQQGELAPVDKPHKHTGACATWRGSSIHLGEPCQQAGQWVLAVAVGLENALRVHACTGLPVWAVTEEHALKGFSFPRSPRINRLLCLQTRQRLPLTPNSYAKHRHAPSMHTPCPCRNPAIFDITHFNAMTHQQAARHDTGPAHFQAIPWAELAPGSHRLKCPQCGKHARSDKTLGITIDHQGHGVAHCFRCGHTSNHRPDRPDHRRYIQRTPHSRPQVQAPAKRTQLSTQGRALWEACRPLNGTDGAAYLTARRCALPPADGHLRFHPSLKHAPSGYVGPALVALVTHTITGQAMTLHRTWIQANGKKAEVEPARLMLGGHSKQGGVIRLWPDECVTTSLAIGEGIETCLSLGHAFNPVWALIDAGNLAAMPVLPGVECLLIARDRDPAGENAATQCAARWSAAGAVVRITAQASNDLNDELQEVA